jgi:hypothetical protein
MVLRYLGAVVRGLVVAARWWRRWVTVRDYREAAELAEKLADKFVETRALTLFRWTVTGAVAAAAALTLAILDLLYGHWALWSGWPCCSQTKLKRPARSAARRRAAVALAWGLWSMRISTSRMRTISGFRGDSACRR